MDKEQLKKLILSCKPAVLKAKVRIVRKLIKKMKILEKCKDATMKEKKLKKASRVLEEIVIINRLKVFDVMCFALRTTDFEEALKTPSNERLHACAVLAKFNDVDRQVNTLRKKFKKKAELFSLLDSLEEERRNKAKGKAEKSKAEKKKTKPVKKKRKLEGEDKLENKNVVANGEVQNKAKVKVKKLISKAKTSNEKVQVKKGDREPIKEDNKSEIKIVQVHCDSREDSKISSVPSNEEKIDDPFFVGKKVIKPKFINTEDNQIDEPLENSNLKQRAKDSLWKMKDTVEPRDPINRTFSNKKPEKRKSGSLKPTPKEEDLHPSWAAKKSVQPIIQPFQGKKIKFDD